MQKPKTTSYREAESYLRQPLGKKTIQGLETDRQIADELWILVEYLSEVYEVGLNHFISKGMNRKDAKVAYKHFQSYIRQAKNYYFSAEKLHPRSSALLYYYCFLNLAKAAIIQVDPKIGGKRIVHGINCLPKDFKKIKKQSLKILPDPNDEGAFQKLYLLYYGQKIKNQTISVPQLFNYCTDISYQCAISGYGLRKVEPCYYISLINRSNKTAWPLIGIPNFKNMDKYKRSLLVFHDKFEQVEVPELLAREFFKVSREVITNFTFFQSKQVFSYTGEVIPSQECRALVIDSFASMFQVNYFDNNFEFNLSLPYKINKQIPINEPLSIYLIMFYLSSLVRYNPSYLEELLTKKESWIVDSFITSCSLTFLRSIVSLIVGTDYVIKRR